MGYRTKWNKKCQYAFAPSPLPLPLVLSPPSSPSPSKYFNFRSNRQQHCELFFPIFEFSYTKKKNNHRPNHTERLIFDFSFFELTIFPFFVNLHSKLNRSFERIGFSQLPMIDNIYIVSTNQETIWTNCYINIKETISCSISIAFSFHFRGLQGMGVKWKSTKLFFANFCLNCTHI